MSRMWLWMVLWLGGCTAVALAGEGAGAPAPAPVPLAGTQIGVGPSVSLDPDRAPDEPPQHVVKVLRTTNKAQTNRYVVKVYDFKNVNPADVLRYFRRVAEIEESGWHTYLAPDGKSGKVAMIIPAYQVPYVDKLMAEIDKTGLTTSSGTAELWYRLKHRSAADAAFINVLKQYVTPGANVTPDLTTNSLVFYDAQSAIDTAEQVLAARDTPVPMVRLDTTIYEIYVANDGTMGLDFHAWKNGPGRSLFSYGAFREKQRGSIDVSGTPAPTANVPINPGTGVNTSTLLRDFTASGTNSSYFLDMPSAYFDALSEKGKGQVRSASTVTVNHGQQATFQTTDSILYYAVMDATPGMAGATPGPKDLSVNANAIAATPKGGYRTDLIDPSSGNSATVPKNRTLIGRTSTRAALVNTLNAQDTGVYVRITPVVGTDRITMTVTTQVVNCVAYADNGTPVTNERTTTTEVNAADGHEIVVGGMVYETPGNMTRKVPILGSLPGVGYLFGGEVKQNNKRLVVVAIKPTRVAGFTSTNAEDTDTIEKAKGNTPIPLPGVKVKLAGDPINP